MQSASSGIFPMLYAFFREDGRLNERAIRLQVQAAMAHGAHGLAALGLGTEVGKLSAKERIDLLGWASDELGGQLPLVVTIVEPDVPTAIAAVERARSAGASWVILQPPPGAVLDERQQIAFYGTVADNVGLPVAIQNAPEYLPTSLELDGILRLNEAHPNVRMIKAEGSALYVHQLIQAAAGGQLAVFNGRGGLELTDNLRAGCAGVIPGMDSFDVQARIFSLMQTGDTEEAERVYRSLLPLIVFIMQNLSTFICYGKRVAARRLGLGPVYDRQPALPPDPFGLAIADRLSADLPPYF
ncbi:dihydrodipicolinate synthase family protein [Devosia aurantiaca]|uniref:Dihydrodipicolinate synthase family protein n=1 Tax=Devosia aurantiaca TaxID=2714858 RepID=A0A6M1SQK5_9HYPH|nr:dihydrodipicolinate synthase family protein [Devosia aurantiaca]NGP18846.1 dihydrodipicolinate synthase family protein [Devosia aurantiaca]